MAGTASAPKDIEKRAEDDAKLDKELENSFPASDPPSVTAPGHGETGAKEANDAAEKDRREHNPRSRPAKDKTSP